MDRDAENCVQLHWLMLPDLISSLLLSVTGLQMKVMLLLLWP